MLKDPGEILNQARDSFEEGDYKSSLEHYQWFFTHAVQVDSTWVGAKYRSLKEWYCLAEKYQPAYEALVKQKDKSLRSFQKYKGVEPLSEYSDICHFLKTDQEFIDLFAELCRNQIDFAKSAYISVENILIANREWELCNICIDNSLEKYNMLLERFDELMRISKEGFNGEYNDIYEQKFERDIQNLFWILHVGKRDDEVGMIQEKLKKDLLERNIEVK